MSIAKYIRLSDSFYPLFEQDIRLENPNISYPEVFQAEGYAVVFEYPKPDYNPLTQFVREIAPELTQLGHWEQRWEVVDLDVETITANQVAERTRLVTQASIVSMRQARLALFQTILPDNTNLLDTVNAAVATMPQAAQIAWEYATEVRRDNALVLAIKELLTWTDTQMDDLFILAYTL